MFLAQKRLMLQEENTPATKPNRPFLVWLILTILLGAVLFFLGFTLGRSYPRVSPLLRDLPAVPESERELSGAILGLESNRVDLALLPILRKIDGATPEEFLELKKQLYGLFLRCSQGALMNAWPKDSVIHLGVPDPSVVTESLGSELDYFEDYLKTRCNWKDSDISRCIQPFQSNQALIWAQDAGEIFERPGSPIRTVYHSSSDVSYEGFDKSLTDADPSSIATLPLPPGVSCEGGDLEVSWGTDHKAVLLLGRHRVLNYLKIVHGVDGSKRALKIEEIDEAKRAYSTCFEMPVQVVPESALFEPTHACSELFHLDMVVSVMDPHDGQPPRAFVPVLMDGKVQDALFDKPLDPKLVSTCRWELEEVAKQMASLGYKVVRLPFSDHPVRSPVNFVKYRDPKTGRYKVLFSKFPNALPLGDPQTPQRYFNMALSQLRAAGEAWQRTGSPDSFHAFQKQVADTWKILGLIENAPNPIFEECARRISAEGFDVVTVPSYCYGSGGMHCQVLK
jgi:hypothetical protein